MSDFVRRRQIALCHSGVLNPVLSAVERIVEYLKADSARADGQVSHALWDTGLRFEQKEQNNPADNGKVMETLLLALHHHIKSRSSAVDVTAKQRRIGNLVYPLPDKFWDEFNLLPNLPKTPPNPQTMLAFELVCRFRYWSLGKFVEFDTETDCVSMPKGGLPRYDLVDWWVREAFGGCLAETFSSATRVRKLSKNILLTCWPLVLLGAGQPPS